MKLMQNHCLMMSSNRTFARVNVLALVIAG
jgi:hypothetical protein